MQLHWHIYAPLKIAWKTNFFFIAVVVFQYFIIFSQADFIYLHIIYLIFRNADGPR